MGVKDSTLAFCLQNSMEAFKPTPTRLNWSLQIIKACGGTEVDLDNWKAYHYAVVEFQRQGSRGGPPRPPRPGDLPTEPLVLKPGTPQAGAPNHRDVADNVHCGW
jgi:hypothetical protein